MHTFKDTGGRDWPITVTVNTVKRVRDEAGIDLMKVVEDQTLLTTLSSDPFTLVAVLYAACHPKADTEGITPESFGEAMGGDALDHATTALLGALADFFPPHRRGPLKAAVAKLREIQDKAAEMATAKIQSPELTAAALAAIQQHLDSPPPSLGNSSISVQASPALTQAPTLSPN